MTLCLLTHFLVIFLFSITFLVLPVKKILEKSKPLTRSNFTSTLKILTDSKSTNTLDITSPNEIDSKDHDLKNEDNFSNEDLKVETAVVDENSNIFSSSGLSKTKRGILATVEENFNEAVKLLSDVKEEELVLTANEVLIFGATFDELEALQDHVNQTHEIDAKARKDL